METGLFKAIVSALSGGCRCAWNGEIAACGEAGAGRSRPAVNRCMKCFKAGSANMRRIVAMMIDFSRERFESVFMGHEHAGRGQNPATCQN